MDISSLVGTLLGLGLLGFAVASGAGFGPYIDIPSLMITIGGMFAGILIAYPLATCLLIPKYVMLVYLNKPDDMIALHNEIQEMATVARRDGILALEEKSRHNRKCFPEKRLADAC